MAEASGELSTPGKRSAVSVRRAVSPEGRTIRRRPVECRKPAAKMGVAALRFPTREERLVFDERSGLPTKHPRSRTALLAPHFAKIANDGRRGLDERMTPAESVEAMSVALSCDRSGSVTLTGSYALGSRGIRRARAVKRSAEDVLQPLAAVRAARLGLSGPVQ
jgi:hypothetical protein